METNATKRTDIFQIDPRNIVVIQKKNIEKKQKRIRSKNKKGEKKREKRKKKKKIK